MQETLTDFLYWTGSKRWHLIPWSRFNFESVSNMYIEGKKRKNGLSDMKVSFLCELPLGYYMNLFTVACILCTVYIHFWEGDFILKMHSLFLFICTEEWSLSPSPSTKTILNLSAKCLQKKKSTSDRKSTEHLQLLFSLFVLSCSVAFL